MSGICDKCRRKPCSGKGEGLIFCDFYIGTERNYEKLFGTPERAARTLADKQLVYAMQEYDALLEWLKGASDGE